MTRRFYISADEVAKEALERDFVFDTNVWLFIYGLQSDDHTGQTAVYSAFYKRVLESNRRIFLLNTIISEYVHRSLKMREDKFPSVSIKEKIHQQQKYAQWMNDIADEVSYLNEDCEKLDDGFSTADPENMCRRCSGKSMNYNDVIIADACRSRNLLLVTDDADFSCETIDIVTRNRKLTKP